MRAAFMPQEWARLADIPMDSTLNLAVDSGVTFDALYLVRSAGGVPATTDLVVIEISYWSFNRNRSRPGTGQRHGTPEEVRQWGSLSDRLAIDEPGERLRFIGDWIWPLYQRRGPPDWMRRIQAPWRIAPSLPPPGPSWDPSMHTRLARRVRMRPANIALDHFHRPELSGFELHSLDALLAQIEASNARVVLARLPTRAAYLETARSLPGARAFIEEVDREIADRLNDRVSSFDCRNVGGCGLREATLIDYGHMTPQGAREYTRRLFEKVAEPAGDG